MNAGRPGEPSGSRLDPQPGLERPKPGSSVEQPPLDGAELRQPSLRTLNRHPGNVERDVTDKTSRFFTAVGAKPVIIRDPVPSLQLKDIFIAVKTTRKFHRARLSLLLDTWISRTRDHTYIFTDEEDEELTSRGFHLIVTNCSSEHSHQALSCKMASEYEAFIASEKKWFCHVDDDNYVLPHSLLSLLAAFPPDGDVYVGKPSLNRPIEAAEPLPNNQTCLCVSVSLVFSGGRFSLTSDLIRLPDDCTVGYIVERRLGVPLLHSQLFHSHLENLQLIAPQNLRRQVTLSYGTFENKLNSIELKGVFTKQNDPSSGGRFSLTSDLIRLPDDCTVGYIVERRLGVPLLRSQLFHSHLENLQLIAPQNLRRQVTLSYGTFENKLNSIELKGIFTKQNDPSR
ncbi:UNVERIFIED_CONTAM: hypothetical protein FKN15_015053 [Acipenser sinensis]